MTMLKNRPTVSTPHAQDVAPRVAHPAPDLVREDLYGHYRKERAHLRYHVRQALRATPWQQRLLAWLRDNVHPDIPRAYYTATLGHDLHVSTYAELYVRHFHYGQVDPFSGRAEYHAFPVNSRSLAEQGLTWAERDALTARFPGSLLVEKEGRLFHYRPGWWENVGRVSRGKVTTAFRDFEVDQLIAETSVYGDYKFHRPGTGATAEANTETALVTDAGLEATGTQIEGASPFIYKSVATVTADASETWQEHSIRNVTGAAGGTMMDRSLISPTVPVVNLDTVEFTYELTKNAES